MSKLAGGNGRIFSAGVENNNMQPGQARRG